MRLQPSQTRRLQALQGVYQHVFQDSGAALVLGPQKGAEAAVSAANKLNIPYVYLEKAQQQGTSPMAHIFANKIDIKKTQCHGS